jgi:hypothetical protein
LGIEEKKAIKKMLAKGRNKFTNFMNPNMPSDEEVLDKDSSSSIN